MSENKKTSYEAMFLVPPGIANFQQASEPIHNVLARSEAEILSVKPWEERKLAFEIGGNKRGMYVLTYFKVDPLKISEIEHDCQLDEGILRVLIIRRDALDDEQINAETPATKKKIDEPPAPEPAPAPAPEPPAPQPLSETPAEESESPVNPDIIEESDTEVPQSETGEEDTEKAVVVDVEDELMEQSPADSTEQLKADD